MKYALSVFLIALEFYMRSYVIPPSLKDGGREKIIGGVLDIYQAGMIFLGGIIALVIFLLLAPISKVLGVIVGISVGGPVTFVFGFLKIKGYPVVKYAKYKKRFKNKNKILANKRKIK